MMNAESVPSKQVDIKLAYNNDKIKRLKEVPATFQALKTAVEASFKIEQPSDKDASKQKSQYSIKYKDQDEDWVNVSDDEDLQAALAFS